MESTQEIKQEEFQVSVSPSVPNVTTITSEPKRDENLVVKKEEDDDEYEDVAEDGLVIVQENYDAKNEFYDTTVADLIAKASSIPEQKQNENPPSLQLEHPSKEEQTIIVKKGELKSEQEDEVFIQNESDRVKQLMDARRTKKMEQRSLNGQSEDNILHPASIQRKTIMAKDHATNPTALYHMQMTDPDQVQDQEREIQIEPIKQKKVTNVQNQMWQVSPNKTPNIQETQSTSDQTSEGGGETEPDEQIPSNTQQNQIESQPSTDVETVLEKISDQILNPTRCGECERNTRDCICDAVERILRRRTPKAKSPMPVQHQQQTIKFSLDFELTCKIRTNSTDIIEYSPYASD